MYLRYTVATGAKQKREKKSRIKSPCVRYELWEYCDIGHAFTLHLLKVVFFCLIFLQNNIIFAYTELQSWGRKQTSTPTHTLL